MTEGDKYKQAIVTQIIRVYKFYEMESLADWLKERSEEKGKYSKKFKVLHDFALKNQPLFDYPFKVNKSLRDSERA